MSNDQRIVIDSEFKNLIPAMKAEEREQLEKNLLADGCRDALVVWKTGHILLDGHNRHEICTKHHISFRVTEIDLSDRDAAADWIDANQLGRRNLKPDHYALLRGRIYNRSKKQGERKDLTCGQNVHKLKTAEVLAKEYNVDEKTIRRDGEYASAIETLKDIDPEIESKVVQGTAPTKKTIVEAAKPIKEAKEAIKKTTHVGGMTKADVQAVVLQSQLENAKEEAKAIMNKPKRVDKSEPTEHERKKARKEARDLIVGTNLAQPAQMESIRDAIIHECANGRWHSPKSIITTVIRFLKPLIVTEDDVIYCLKFWIGTNQHPYHVDISAHNEFRFMRIKHRIPDVKYLQKCLEDMVPLIDKLIKECSKHTAAISHAAIKTLGSQIKAIHESNVYYVADDNGMDGDNKSGNVSA